MSSKNLQGTQKLAIYLPNLAGGGVERAYLQLSRYLLQHKVGIDLVLGQEDGEYLSEIPNGVNLICLNGKNKFLLVWKLAKYLKNNKPDAVLTGGDVVNLMGLLAGMIAGQTGKVVLSQRAAVEATWRIHRPMTYPLYLALIRWLYRKADRIIVNSEYSLSELVRGFGIQGSKCTLIYNLIDLNIIDDLARTKVFDDWYEPDSPPVIISVGSLSPRKDFFTLIEAFSIVKQCQKVRLLILGEGQERARLEALISQYGLKNDVRLPGFIPNPFPFLHRSRVFVSSSLAEGCPNVIQQALACNISIVATDCPGGTAELLGHGQWGCLVPVGDKNRMAEAIISRLNDSNQPEGRLRALDFSPEKTVRKYIKILFPQIPEESIEINP